MGIGAKNAKIKDGLSVESLVVCAKVCCSGAANSNSLFALSAPFCGYSDSAICINPRPSAVVLLRAVACHPFAVSFPLPGFHDWRTWQLILSLDAHRVDGLSDFDRVYGIHFDAARSERTGHTDAERDSTAFS
jgi:hypothetical protein